MLPVNRRDIDEFVATLKAAPGVTDAVVALDEGAAYLKIWRKRFDAGRN